MAPPNDDPDGATADEIDSHVPGAFPSSSTNPEPSVHQTLTQAVYSRRSEFTRQKTLRIKVGTWNVAAYKDSANDLGTWFVQGKGIAEDFAGLAVGDKQRRKSRKSTDEPQEETEGMAGQPDVEKFDIYALGLQEILDINSPAQTLRPYTDPTDANRYKKAMEEALPEGYTLVADHQLVGILLLVYASPELAPEIQSVSTTSVGTGLMGYMGNKGAVSCRLVLSEETKIVFVSCHLAAGTEKGSLDRRNWDANQVVSRTKFDPVTDALGVTQPDGDTIGEEDFAFWVGDLNYRLEGIPGDSVRHLLMLHTRNFHEKDPTDPSRPDSKGSSKAGSDSASPSKRSSLDSPSSKAEDTEVSIPSPQPLSPTSDNDSLEGLDAALPPSEDPAHLQTTLGSLLPHDELRQQQKLRKAFHDGWREGVIDFLPTYKYDIGTIGVFDSSEKRRCPSWCDRILYRTRRSREAYLTKVKEEEEARKRDEEMKSKGLEEAANDEDVLFDYDPEADADTGADDYNEDEDAEESPGAESMFEDDMILLESYNAHQRIVSSDHKPLDAIFTLKYNAVDRELKARIHAEVARQLDRAENEGRPTVTLIADRHSQSHSNRPSLDEPDAGQADQGGQAQNTESLDLGSVRYRQRKRQTMTIANTGRVTASLGFVDRPTEQGNGNQSNRGAMPRWLTAQPDREPDKAPRDEDPKYEWFNLEPGDACNVEFTSYVKEMDLVRPLNDGDTSLDDVLVLRVAGGRDHFIPVHARWMPSSFGRSIDKLIRLPEGGVRKLLKRRRPSQVETDDPSSKRISQSAVKWSAPRELFRLTEAVEELLERSLAEWDMTSHLILGSSSSNKDSRPTSSSSDFPPLPPWDQHAGWPFDSDSWTLPIGSDSRESLALEVREAIDCDRGFSDEFTANTPALQRLEVVSETLLEFLGSLEDGVITAEDWSRLEAGMMARDKAKQNIAPDDERSWILEQLSVRPAHNVAFVLLTAMLSRMINTINSAVTVGPDAQPRHSIEVPSTPKAQTSRKRTLSALPEIKRREVREQSLAGMLAEKMIRPPEGKIKDKERRARQERMENVIEVFLKQ
jgi:inositol polyphosphate 5-phosphatase INPP5B/F